MVEKEKRKKRLQALLWAGFIFLLLVVGLGPLFLVISYTRDLNLGQFLNRSSGQEMEADPELPGYEPYLVQYFYRFCEHHGSYEPSGVPEKLELPPAALVELAVALHKNNSSIQDIMSYLNNTEGWHVANMRLGAEGTFLTFSYLGDLCPDCEGSYYVGIFNDDDGDKIAVFQGKPPAGKVIRVTPHPVRDDIRKDLEEGVPLKSLDGDELNKVLQEYTS